MTGVSSVSYLVKENNELVELETTQDIKRGGGLELSSRRLGGCGNSAGVTEIIRKTSKDFNELFCWKIDEGIIVFPVRK